MWQNQLGREVLEKALEIILKRQSVKLLPRNACLLWSMAALAVLSSFAVVLHKSDFPDLGLCWVNFVQSVLELELSVPKQ